MNFDIKRWKMLDYVVLGLFVLMIIGVSLTWWKTDVSGGISSGIEAAGVTAEDMALAEAAGIDVEGLIEEATAAAAMYEVKAQGWDFDSIVFCWVLSLFAALVALAKPLFPVGKPLPKWYMQALATMAFGGIITFITFLRLVVAPEGGHDFWNPGAGGFITLIAGLIMLGVGYLMWRDKTGDYGFSKLPKIATNSGAASPPPSGPTSSGGTPPAAQ